MLIRYPGSKRKIAREIIASFPFYARMELFMDKRLSAERFEYREPFFGAGAVGFEILRELPMGATAWINDKDFSVAALWHAVKDIPDELIERVREHTPGVDGYRAALETVKHHNKSIIELAFSKLVIQQQSYSGLGPMAGSPLGGWGQSNDTYRIDCRWNPESLCRQIRELSRLLKQTSTRITSGDFTKCSAGDTARCFYYVDPPYVVKGSQLYSHAMSDEDHRRLRVWLKTLAGEWIVSYDECPLVRRLYGDCSIREISADYTISGPHRKNNELLISPRVAKAAEVA